MQDRLFCSGVSFAWALSALFAHSPLSPLLSLSSVSYVFEHFTAGRLWYEEGTAARLRRRCGGLRSDQSVHSRTCLASPRRLHCLAPRSLRPCRWRDANTI